MHHGLEKDIVLRALHWLRTIVAAHNLPLRGRNHRVPAAAGKTSGADGAWRFHGLQRVQQVVYFNIILRSTFFNVLQSNWCASNRLTSHSCTAIVGCPFTIHSAMARATPQPCVIHTASATQKPFSPDHSPINGKLSTVKENKPFIVSVISALFQCRDHFNRTFHRTFPLFGCKRHLARHNFRLFVGKNIFCFYGQWTMSIPTPLPGSDFFV